MKKSIFAISALLLTTSIQASETAKVVVLEENVRKLEEQLHKAVEELNAQLAAEAEKEVPQAATSASHDPHPSRYPGNCATRPRAGRPDVV